MDIRPEPPKKILTLLRLYRNGLTITDIANKLKLNRNSIAKYLEMLLISGDVALNSYGPAKVYTISHKMPVSAMLKFSADIIIMIDQEMRILDVNENALEVLGLSRNDLIGNRVDDLNSPIISRLSIPDVFKDIQVTGEIQREFVVTKQNEDYHYRVRLIPTVFDNREEGMTVIGEDITEQIRFEERLLISESRFRAIVEDQTDFICRYLPDGTLKFINESLSQYIGISCKVVCGQSIFSYIFSEDQGPAREAITDINKNPQSQSIEVRILDRTGQYRWHQWNTKAIYDNNGKLIECQSVGRDITELKESQEALRLSELLYRTILDNIQDVYYRSDKEGNLTMVSPSAPKLLGYNSVQEIIGQNIAETIYFFPEERKQFLDTISKEKKVTDYEITLKKRDGSPVIISTNSQLLYDTAGNITGIEGIIKDISLKKQAQRALKESEERYRLLFTRSPIGIVQLDKNGIIVTANEKFADIMGVSPSQLTGFDTLNRIQNPALVAAIKESLNGKTGFFEGEYTSVLIGKRLILRMVSQPIGAGEGHFCGVIGIFEDISERHQAEERDRHQTLLFLRTQQTLVQMAKLPADTIDIFLHQITMTDAKTIGVDRVSVWLFSDDLSEMVCTECYDRSANSHMSSMRLKQSDYPRYFTALTENRILAADDARQDERTKEFTDTYLIPLNITSMLDIPIRRGGQMVGIVCHEHTGHKRSWDPLEQDFAASVADLISSALERAERKTFEEALFESERRYRLVVEDQTELICRFTPDGIITFVNDAYCRYFGLNKSACIGSPHKVLLPDEDAGLMKQHLASLTPENPTGTIEHRILLPDGKTRWHFWTDRACFDADGKVTEYQSVGIDTTDKQEQTQKIRESEERFRMITELSPFPLSLIDSLGNYRYLNKKFEQLFGYTITDIPTGKDWFLKAFPDSTERTNAIQTWKHERGHAEWGLVRPRLFPVTCKDGTVRQIHFCPITLTSGEQFVVYEDLTDKTESDRLRCVLASIVNSSNDAIIGKKLDGTIQSWNKAAERYYGYLAEEVIGKPIDLIIPPELRDQIPLFLRRVATGETIERFDTIRIRKDGSRIEVCVTLSPIKNEEGQIVGISTIAQNIAERKKSDVSRIFRQQVLHRR